ncbi:hypothetical protein E2C01_084214 [Portunus trituberculatus]|uniref:Uncharacterized protein n=1 Tax=Portunus trituberculatus TaxID=210409 RepID=A0A5B7J5P7_PORTR|nr:hypothetical protein [Portunus trituberculatus]
MNGRSRLLSSGRRAVCPQTSHVSATPGTRLRQKRYQALHRNKTQLASIPIPLHVHSLPCLPPCLPHLSSSSSIAILFNIHKRTDRAIFPSSLLSSSRQPLAWQLPTSTAAARLR